MFRKFITGCICYYLICLLVCLLFLVFLNWKYVSRTVSGWNDRNNIESYTKEYRDYCEKGEFQKAYESCKKLERYTRTEEDEKYIIIHEATSVLESQGVEGLPKIAFIVKEHNADWLYKDLVDIAEAMGNEDLVIRLKKLAGIPVNEYSNEEE